MPNRTKAWVRSNVRPTYLAGGRVKVTIPYRLVVEHGFDRGMYVNYMSSNNILMMEITRRLVSDKRTLRLQKSGSSVFCSIPMAVMDRLKYPYEGWVAFEVYSKKPHTFYLRKTKKPPVPRKVRADWKLDEEYVRLKAESRRLRSRNTFLEKRHKEDMERIDRAFKHGGEYEQYGDVIDTGYEWEAAIDPTVSKVKAHFRCFWTFHRKHRIRVSIHMGGAPLATYDNYDETVTFKDGKVCKIGSPGWAERLAESGLDGQAFLSHLDEWLPYAREYVERWRAAQYYRKHKPGDD